WGRTGDKEVLQRFSGYGELHPFHRFAADLERHMPRVVDEHAVAAIGEIERDVLVRLFAGGPTVRVPDIHRLAVLHKRSEPLAETVDQLADSELELLVDEDPSGSRSRLILADLDDAGVDEGIRAERHQ